MLVINNLTTLGKHIIIYLYELFFISNPQRCFMRSMYLVRNKLQDNKLYLSVIIWLQFEHLNIRT